MVCTFRINIPEQAMCVYFFLAVAYVNFNISVSFTKQLPKTEATGKLVPLVRLAN